MAKAKRKAKKLQDAKKKAELNHESFNLSMSMILMSDSESDGDDSDSSDSSLDDLTLSHTSLNASKSSLNASKKSLTFQHKDDDDVDREVALLEASFSHFALEK